MNPKICNIMPIKKLKGWFFILYTAIRLQQIKHMIEVLFLNQRVLTIFRNSVSYMDTAKKSDK